MRFLTRYRPQTSDHFITVSTDFIDDLLPTLSPSELKVLLYLVRWENSSHLTKCAREQICKGTGLSNKTVKLALDSLENSSREGGPLLNISQPSKMSQSRKISNTYNLSTINREQIANIEEDKEDPEYLTEEEIRGIETIPPGDRISHSNSVSGDRIYPPKGDRNYPLSKKRKEGKKRAPSRAHGEQSSPPLPPSLIPKGTKAYLFPLPSEEEVNENYDYKLEEEDLVDHVSNCKKKFHLEFQVASKSNNHIIHQGFFRGMHIDLPDSLLPVFDTSAPEWYSRTMLLIATNIMVYLVEESDRHRVPVLPMTLKQVDKLAGVMIPFYGDFDTWESRFTKFYRWVLDNKSNIAIDLLPSYFSDWLSVGVPEASDLF